MVRSHWASGVAVVLVVWGCGGSSTFTGEGEPGTGGSGQGGVSAQGGDGGKGGTGGKGGAGANGGAGGVGGGSGGTGGASGNAVGGGPSGAGGDVGGSAGDPQGGASGLGGTGALGGMGALGAMGGSTAAQGGIAGESSCLDPDVSAGPTFDGASIASTTEGSNGSFDDACDENGNLTEYTCETLCVAPRIAAGGRTGTGGLGSGGTVSCGPTGRVVGTTIDCGGSCVEGSCFGWCAVIGDEFDVSGAGGTELSVEKDGVSFSCTVAFQREGYDCLSQSLVGRTMVVTSIGACTYPSTTFGWDDPESSLEQECAFTCSLT